MSMRTESNNESKITNKDAEDSMGKSKQFFKRNNKRATKMSLLDKKNFVGGTLDMNWQLFQTIEESKDATQYVKMVEALARYAFKT